MKSEIAVHVIIHTLILSIALWHLNRLYSFSHLQLLQHPPSLQQPVLDMPDQQKNEPGEDQDYLMCRREYHVVYRNLHKGEK